MSRAIKALMPMPTPMPTFAPVLRPPGWRLGALEVRGEAWPVVAGFVEVVPVLVFGEVKLVLDDGVLDAGGLELDVIAP